MAFRSAGGGDGMACNERGWPCSWTRAIGPLAAALCLLIGLVHPRATAQEGPIFTGAPAGNEHPQATPLGAPGSDGAGDQGLANPFGTPGAETAFTDDRAKLAFAAAVDLEPLRGLAVFHNGRVKIIDTLARELVGYVTGRARPEVPLVTPPGAGPGAGTGPAEDPARFDPVFTLLDWMIDPAWWFDRPVVYVDYLPLREAYLELAFPDDPAQALRWKGLTRVSPVQVRDLTDPIFSRLGDIGPVNEGIMAVEARLRAMLLSPSALEMIAPSSAQRRWHHVSEWPQSSRVRELFTQLGAAWRAGDAAAVNRAVADLAVELPAINPETYPGGRRGLELAYNRVAVFELGMWAYFAGFLALVLAFGTGRGWLQAAGKLGLGVGVGLHAAGFIARCVLAERFAIQNQTESMIGLSLFAALVGLAAMVATRRPIFGASGAATGFLVLIMATQAGVPGALIEREAAILNTSVLLKYHVTTVLTSYGLITLGFVVSCFYLVTHYAGAVGARPAGLTPAGLTPAGLTPASLTLGAAAVGLPAGVGVEARGPTAARTLADLDSAQMIMLQLAFWTLGVGILLGAWWADHSWGRWWAWDPKETWALITWIVYLITIHVRFGGVRDKALVTAWLSVAGFVVMLFTYFGVNLLLPGLHAYA